MSRELIDRNDDLRRLREEGYDIAIVHNHLIVRRVPYLTASGSVAYGDLISTLSLRGEAVLKPSTHKVYFTGSRPHKSVSKPLESVEHNDKERNLGGGLRAAREFSHKPSKGYGSYYEKMVTYASVLEKYARVVDPGVSAKSGIITDSCQEDSPFVYADTATSRAGIGGPASKFEGQRIAIIGLGGTGSYVLDLVAKTPVRAIELFDDDTFDQHNAFRAPGAASLGDLKARRLKVDYFSEVYGKLHRQVNAHAERVTNQSHEELKLMDFVFVCVDSAAARREIFELLERLDLPFIDVGIGVRLDQGVLSGKLRTSLSEPGHRDSRCHAPTHSHAEDDLYATNIQIADLNALNAAFAVFRWKRWCGFYQDQVGEHTSFLTLATNHLHSEGAS
jgi:hypothetical protein